MIIFPNGEVGFSSLPESKRPTIMMVCPTTDMIAAMLLASKIRDCVTEADVDNAVEMSIMGTKKLLDRFKAEARA